MDTQYIFGHDGDAMILETIGDAPSIQGGTRAQTPPSSGAAITGTARRRRRLPIPASSSP